VIALVAAIAILAPAEHVVANLLSDSYMTLYAGRWVAAHGIPRHEVFTIAAQGRRWIDQQWLAEVTDFELWRLGGYALVAIASVALIGLAYALLAWTMLRRGAGWVATLACCALAIVVALPETYVRSQAFAFPLFAALLAICVWDLGLEQPRRPPLALLPLLWLWANLHGSALVGAALATLYLAARAARFAVRDGDARRGSAYGALAAACAIAPLVTPYGLGTARYYLELFGNGAVAAASPEWRAPALGSLALSWFVLLVALTLVTVALAARRGRRPTPALLAGAAIMALATVLASRNEVWFAIIAALLIAESAGALLATAEPTMAIVRLQMGLAVGLAGLGLGLLAFRGAAGYERLTPLHELRASAAYAGAHPCARVLADNASASALLWHYPRLAGRVAFDARLEQYPQAALRRWIAYQEGTGAGWRRTLRGYQLLIGSRRYNPALASRLARVGGTVLARDALGIAVALPSAGCA
jgi:hypothetical protein